MTFQRDAPRPRERRFMPILTTVKISLAFVLGFCFSSQLQWFNSGDQSNRNLRETSTIRPPPPPTGAIAGTKAAHQPNPPSYELANKQSFGFFTDITDENWHQMQKIHARTFPNYHSNMVTFSNGINDKGDWDKLKKSNSWNGENFQVEFHCPMAQRVPPSSEADGPKWVCDPHRLAKKKDCLIYSFGSNGKAEFEHGILEALGKGNHCEIHTFDMITHNKRNGKFSDALKGSSTFHPWGLGTPEEAKSKPRKFKTLEQTMEALGHTGRTIDIFKIDCEWCEWHTYQQWLKQDIRQLLVETHNAPMPHAQSFFQDIHDEGFVIFSKEANYPNGGGGVEFAFLKLSTDFFINDTTYKQLGHKTIENREKLGGKKHKKYKIKQPITTKKDKFKPPKANSNQDDGGSKEVVVRSY